MEELCDTGFSDLLSSAFHLLALNAKRNKSRKDIEKELEDARDAAEQKAKEWDEQKKKLETDLKDKGDEADQKTREWDEQRKKGVEELKKKEEELKKKDEELKTLKDSVATWEAKSRSQYQLGQEAGKLEVEDKYFAEMMSHVDRAYQFGWDGALDAVPVPSDSGLRGPVSVPESFWLSEADQAEGDRVEDPPTLLDADMATGEELRPLGYVSPHSPILVDDDDHDEVQVDALGQADGTINEQVAELDIGEVEEQND